MTAANGTLLLSRAEVAELLSLDECIAAVEEAFRLLGEGRVGPPGVLGVHVAGGGFHIKAGTLPLARPYFAAKVNANFPGNPARFGLPTIQGVIVLADAEKGQPLAILDSMEITALRTAAATAVAAKYLARLESQGAAICGCGVQGRMQLRALARVLPLRKAYAWDADEERAREFARELSPELGLEVQAVEGAAGAARESDVSVTCTPARSFFLRRGDLRPGAFLAAVGADHPEKQEVEPALLAASTVVCDLVEQCAAIGDLHHALVAGVMTAAQVHAELAEVVAGKKPGRRSAEEIIVFDSTGMALQDVAAAARVYEKALRAGRGLTVELAQ
ncbi:MAG TPA: ornithine cyclodeaminase family protein, partial [Terriglobales bacterium]|nr:ornithine cyclodeaminase family protein [Terriglobales bacterium]